MRAPSRPTLPYIDEAAEVILIALDRRQLQEQTYSAEDIARFCEFREHAERERQEAERAAEAIYQSVRRQLLTLPPEDRAWVAARLSGEFSQTRRGRGRPPRNQHSFNWWIARELPFFMQVLQARYPTVQITKTWTIKVVCKAFPEELDENNFRNFLRGPERPRHRP